MEALALDPRTSLWLIAAREEPALAWSGDGASSRTPNHRYRQAASAQKIFYDPLSITQDLALEVAFEALGEGAPTVDQARAVAREIEDQIAGYRFEAEGDIWHIRNTSTPTFGDPVAGERWVLFARTEESETRRVELEGSEVAAALAWLPLLDGHHTAAEIATAAGRTPAGRRVHEALEAIEALFPLDEEAFDLQALPELLFLSHSAVFIRGQEASILIDPAILSSTELLSREGRRPFEIAARVDAVLISHCHWDHFSFQTMLRIPRATRIFVPRALLGASLGNPPLRTHLEAFGFTNVVEVSDWDTVSVGDVTITFVPFFGEPFGLDSRFDAFTYLVRANGRTIYGSLNACHDEAGDMNAIFERLGKEDVDVFLFGSSAQRHQPLYRAANMRHYSNELIQRPDLVRYHPDVDDVIRWCGSLRPKTIIPYANFVYFGAEDPADERLGAGSNVEAYWASFEGRGSVPASYLTWRSEMARLAGAVSHPLLMLHPMQGLRL